jgi:hypothetical protein
MNLRSTRETELAEYWPEYVVCAWIGNLKQRRGMVIYGAKKVRKALHDLASRY